jgi:hypothetical protein
VTLGLANIHLGDKLVNKKKLFRRFAGEAIKNSHIAIKSCWMILFTGGTVALLNSFDRLTSCTFSLPSEALRCSETHLSYAHWSASHWYFFFLYLSLFAVYVLTFYRFYVGNIRVFDIRYDEVFKFVANMCDKDILLKVDQALEDAEYQHLFEYSDVWIKKESIFLILQTLLIVYLAVVVLHPARFITIYFIILSLDVAWIKWNEKMETPRQTLQTYFSNKFFEIFDELKPREKDIRKMFPSGAMKLWRENNAIATIVLAPLVALIWFAELVPDVSSDVFFSNDILTAVMFGLSAVVLLYNCISDLYETRTFYNPQFNDAHKLVVGAAPRVLPDSAG